MKYSLIRTNGGQINIQDILGAMLDVQLIKPSSFESILDPHDQFPTIQTPRRVQHNNYNTKSIESFVDWLKYSDQFRLSQKLSSVPNNLLFNLIDKRKIDDSNETDQQRKKRRLKEKQDFYNQFKFGADENGRISEKRPASYNEEEVSGKKYSIDDEALTDDDKLSWLTYLAEKDLKLDNNLKFLNTILQDELLKIQNNKKYHPDPKDVEADQQTKFHNHLSNLNKHDHVVLNIEDYIEDKEEHQGQEHEEKEVVLPSKKLMEVLPYNVKYDSGLLDDDLEQYIEYYEKHHPDERQEQEDMPEPETEVPDEGIGGDNSLIM